MNTVIIFLLKKRLLFIKNVVFVGFEITSFVFQMCEIFFFFIFFLFKIVCIVLKNCMCVHKRYFLNGL